MRVYRSHSHYDGATPCVLAIGTFDGVHLGHQRVIKQVVVYAQKHSYPSVLFTFDPHPLELIQPQFGVSRLFSINELIRNVKSIGIDYLIIEKFSKEFAQIPASIFFEKYIYKIFKPSCIFSGYDLKFGQNREGNTELLKTYAQKFSFQVQEVSPVYFDKKIISSSWIREAFQQSDFLKISQLRGSSFSLEGVVISGASRGSQLGFPTANIQTSCRLPQKGVYICQLSLQNQVYPQFYHGVMNIGVNPTFTNPKEPQILKVEVHLIDYKNLSLKGEKVTIAVLKRLRDEKKFEDMHALRKQIQFDIHQAHLYFS